MFLISCKGGEEVECPERELQQIQFDFELELQDWVDLGGTVEMKNAGDVQITSDSFYSGSKAAKFTVSPDSYVNNGNRAELAFDQQIKEGEVTTYEYSVLIPSDYQDVNSLKAEDGKPNWQVLGQWHDQPDICLGETWNDLGSNSPPIAIYYSYLTKEDPEYLKILSGSEISEIYGADPNWDNVSVLTLDYGGKTIAISQIEKGTWYRLKFDIKWSQGDDGHIQVWINDEPFSDGLVSGSNMHNAASHYFKFGLYRNPTIPYTN